MAIELKSPQLDEVLDFWHKSPHSTVFTHPEVLQKVSKRVDWWMAFKGKQPQCLWPICLPDGKQVGLPDLTYYVGPLWAGDVFPMPAHRWLSRMSEVYESFIEHFIEEYDEIQTCLPKGLQDVRAFDWWNYHQPDKPRFEINPRYTACITELNKKSERAIISDFRQLRRRELRNLEGLGPPPRTVEWDVEDLIRLYSEVMERKDTDFQEENRNKITALVDLVNLGYGEVVAYKDPKTSTTIAACLLLFAKREANMVLNLVDIDWRGTGLPAWMITEAILTAQAKGMTCFDFNGANSPNRGDDKHSYGAFPVLYFTILYPGALRIEKNAA